MFMGEIKRQKRERVVSVLYQREREERHREREEREQERQREREERERWCRKWVDERLRGRQGKEKKRENGGGSLVERALEDMSDNESFKVGGSKLGASFLGEATSLCRQQNPSSFYFWDSYLRITIQKSICESHNFPNDPIIKS